MRTTTAICDQGSAVEQVRAAQDVGEVGRLDRRGAEDVHLGRPGVGAVDRRRAGGAPTARAAPRRPCRLIAQQLRARPPADAQRDPAGRPVVGVPEAVGELDDAARLGAAEGVDGLVGVADGDQVAAAAGEQLEQLDLGGVGVLVLVDEQPAGPLALLAQQLRVAVELGDRLADQLGRVVAGGVTAAGGGEGGDGLVLLLEGGGVHPVLAAGLPAPGGQLRRRRRRARWPAAAARAARCGNPPSPRAGASPAGQRTAPSSSASPRSSSATTASCSAEVSSRGGGVAAQQRGPAEDAVGVGVEGAGQRLADGAARRGR